MSTIFIGFRDVFHRMSTDKNKRAFRLKMLFARYLVNVYLCRGLSFPQSQIINQRDALCR
jgi:hypothetical protein